MGTQGDYKGMTNSVVIHYWSDASVDQRQQLSTHHVPGICLTQWSAANPCSCLGRETNRDTPSKTPAETQAETAQNVILEQGK